MLNFYTRFILLDLSPRLLTIIYSFLAFLGAPAQAKITPEVQMSLQKVKRKSYFAPNVQLLAAQGILHQTVIHPPTTTSVEDNRQFLRDQFLKIHEENGRLPLLIISHSKGKEAIARLTSSQRKLLSSRVHYVISSKPQKQLSGVLFRIFKIDLLREKTI